VSGYFDRIEQQLVRRVEAGVPRSSRVRLRLNLVAPAVSVVVVLVVAVVFLSVHGTRSPGSRSSGGFELVYQAEPTPQVPHVNLAALTRTVEIMRERAMAAGESGVSIRVSGVDITVRLAVSKDLALAEAEVGTTAQLYFYDWEANALTPNGKTVASQLLAQNPNALQISQGAGEPNEGSMSLYDAVKLASKQPERINPADPLAGYGYYLFGKGGSPACADAAKFYGVTQAAINQHCLLGGPDTSAIRSLALANLRSGLPPGVTSVSQGQLLVIKPGTVVLQAVPSNFSHPPNANSPTTQFYVLKDNVALTGTEITNPQQSTDAGGNPDVEFGFSGKGAKAFTNVTHTIATRGNDVSGAGTKLEQHFAGGCPGRCGTSVTVRVD
jgi:SecD/SecF fusion protein